jgi:CBS domain-containing protein
MSRRSSLSNILISRRPSLGGATPNLAMASAGPLTNRRGSLKDLAAHREALHRAATEHEQALEKHRSAVRRLLQSHTVGELTRSVTELIDIDGSMKPVDAFEILLRNNIEAAPVFTHRRELPSGVARSPSSHLSGSGFLPPVSPMSRRVPRSLSPSPLLVSGAASPHAGGPASLRESGFTPSSHGLASPGAGVSSLASPTRGSRGGEDFAAGPVKEYTGFLDIRDLVSSVILLKTQPVNEDELVFTSQGPEVPAVADAHGLEGLGVSIEQPEELVPAPLAAMREEPLAGPAAVTAAAAPTLMVSPASPSHADSSDAAAAAAAAGPAASNDDSEGGDAPRPLTSPVSHAAAMAAAVASANTEHSPSFQTRSLLLPSATAHGRAASPHRGSPHAGPHADHGSATAAAVAAVCAGSSGIPSDDEGSSGSAGGRPRSGSLTVPQDESLSAAQPAKTKLVVPPLDWAETVGQGIRAFLSKANSGIISVTYLSRRNPFRAVRMSSTLFEVAELLCRGAHRVPVVNADGEVTDIVSQAALVSFIIAHADELSETLSARVTDIDIGSRDVMTVSSSQTALDAFLRMDEVRLSGLAIVDDDGKFLTSTSSRDMKRFALDKGKLTLSMPVLDYLRAARSGGVAVAWGRRPSADPLGAAADTAAAAEAAEAEPFEDTSATTVPEGSTILEILHALKEKGTNRAFCVDEDNVPMRVVSLADIMRLAISH